MAMNDKPARSATDGASGVSVLDDTLESADRSARHAAADCLSMDHVRYEIDRLDRVLVRLIAERQGYIEAAARIKERHEDVRLTWRIEDVVAKVLQESERAGLSKRIAEPVWREMIDRCIDHEFAQWEKLAALESGKNTDITKS